MRYYPTSTYIFVIDTNSYAGNFEREATGFCTGVIGDCGVGESEADLFREEYPKKVGAMENLVLQVPDDTGCYRPTSIYKSPGKSKSKYNSVAIYLQKKPSKATFDFLVARAKKYFEKYEKSVKIRGCRLILEKIEPEITELWKVPS